MTGHGMLTLELGDVRFVVDSHSGGRITSFRLGGTEALTGPELDPNNYGSTLWTSPQSDWGWPPPAEFDELPFVITPDPEGAIAMTGPASGALGVRLAKRFWVDHALGAIVLEYAIQNVTATPKRYALWEVSRVPARALSFYATGTSLAGPLRLEQRAGGTWYAHDPRVLSEVGQKAYGDAGLGFLAHVLPGRVLFVKAFVNPPPDLHAPGEGAVEIYGNDRYVELEVQGPYGAIDPGAWSQPWAVRWYLRPIPAQVDPTLGNAELLAFAAGVADGTACGRGSGPLGSPPSTRPRRLPAERERRRASRGVTA